MKDIQSKRLKTKIYPSVSKLLRPNRKFTAILEQNHKLNIDQHAPKIMWEYWLRKMFFKRCLLVEYIGRYAMVVNKHIAWTEIRYFYG